YPGRPQRLEVHGTRGSAIVEAGELQYLRYLKEGEVAPPYGRQAEPGKREIDPLPLPERPDALRGHAAHIADMVRVAREGTDPYIPSGEARKAVEVISAIYESARRGGARVFPGTPAAKEAAGGP